MADRTKDKPRLSDSGKREAAAREARLAAALRANLRRRKTQAQGRNAPPKTET